MPELLGRREIGLPSAGVKINELIAKLIHVLRDVSYNRSVKHTDCSW